MVFGCLTTDFLFRAVFPGNLSLFSVTISQGPLHRVWFQDGNFLVWLALNVITKWKILQPLMKYGNYCFLSKFWHTCGKISHSWARSGVTTQYKIKKFGMDWILVQGEQCLWVFMWTLNLVLMAADKTTCAYFTCPSSICLIM